jgi:hypothetical protein
MTAWIAAASDQALIPFKFRTFSTRMAVILSRFDSPRGL